MTKSHYCTDSSVNEDVSAGATFVINKYKFETSSTKHASSTQTKLLAITLTLQYTIRNNNKTTLINTDSKAGILALQNRKFTQNGLLLNTIHNLTKTQD